MIRTGCDILASEDCARLAEKKTGLLANPSSMTSRFVATQEMLIESGVELVCIFGPQHGLRGDTQANMIEWKGYVHPRLGIPVHSLYGDTRAPTAQMLSGLDAVVVDLPDVGARPYTYLWTAFLMMMECARQGVELIVLDRPNPIGGLGIEGQLLEEEYMSFVGLYPLPLRHGMTMGEALLMMNESLERPCGLQVVRMAGWKRDMYFEQCGVPWVLPSPNIPTVDTAFVYPGAVMIEATNLSEGRGTTRPFEIVGAPWIDPDDFAVRLAGLGLAGVHFRPLSFEPAWDKHAGTLCGGVQVHVLDRGSFRPARCYSSMIWAAADLYPGKFAWLDPPYEYEEEKMPIDILSGGPMLREAVGRGDPIGKIWESWEMDEAYFRKERQPFLLY